MNTRIQRFSKFFRTIFIVALVISPLLLGSIWLSGGEIFADINDDPAMVLDVLAEGLGIDAAHAPELPLAWSIRLLGLGVDMIPVGIGMLSLWWLIRLFSCFAMGEIFTRNTVKYIRRTGWTVLIGAGITPIHDALLTLVLTMHNAPGNRLVTVSFDSTDFEELIIGGVVILVSWVMEEGRQLQEVNELTV